MAAALSASDVQILTSRDGTCQITVPGDWAAGETGGTSDSPDGKMSAAVSAPKSVDSFEDLKRRAQAIYGRSKVTRDSATVFEMEGKSITNRPNVYRAVALRGNKFCVSEVMYDGDTVEQARKIAATVAASK